MQNLTVSGIDGDSLVAVSDTGEEFRIPVDESVQAKVRQIAAAADTAPKVSPREIQAQIRSGMSAAEVAEATGASLEYVERFEGPVLDERRHIVEQAQRVPVKLQTPTDPLGEESQAFGDVIDERLAGLGANDIRWASWKDESGWLIKVTFLNHGIDHDARWQYDPKRHTLNPTNADAVTLSQAGEITGGLIPRLRAVGVPTADPDPALEPDPAFGPFDMASSPPVQLPPAPTHPSVAPSESTNQTADLLEVLRRRRGERQAADFLSPEEEIDLATHDEVDDKDDSGPVRPVSPFVARTSEAADITAEVVVDEQFAEPDLDDMADDVIEEVDIQEDLPPTLDGIDDSIGEAPAATAPKPRRSNRAPMPSWDEIVFGARERDE